MNDGTTPELQRLRKEVRRLRRYEKIVHGQFFLSAKIARLVTLVWFGPSLVRSIQNLLNAGKTGTPFSEVELAQLIAAVIRRMLRIGLIAIVLAVLPVGVLVWQNTLMREQVTESRKQNVEIVRYNRKTDLKRFLAEVEEEMNEYLNRPVGRDATPLRRVMQSSEFLEKCSNPDTTEYQVIDRILETAFPYVRLLSELYLLDTGVLDPLSDSLSEDHVTERGAATSADVYWLATKMASTMRVVQRCRPHMSPIFRLVLWNAHIDINETYRYMIPATDVKYKYDVAKRDVVVSQEFISGTQPIVKLQLTNAAVRSFSRLVIRCLVAETKTELAAGKDLASKLHEVTMLEEGETKDVQIPFPELRGRELPDAQAVCMVDSAMSEDPAVTTLK